MAQVHKDRPLPQEKSGFVSGPWIIHKSKTPLVKKKN